MELCEEVTVNTSVSSVTVTDMVASDIFNSQSDLVENLQNKLSLLKESRSNEHQTIKEEVNSDCGESVATEFDTSRVTEKDSSCVIKMDNTELSPNQMDGHVQDNCSITSSFSSASSSSSLSSMGITFESERKLSTSSLDQKIVKCFGPAADTQNPPSNRTQAHPRIKRVPSKANPKYRIPHIQKTQRSKSQPHLQVNQFLNQRRNSSPSTLTFGTPTVHQKNVKQGSSMSMPNFNNVYQQQQLTESQPQSQTEQQQQIIYLQIPQPTQSQLADAQGLQRQISSQLQLLVPQIYNQLVTQVNVQSGPLSTVKVSLNQNNSNSMESMNLSSDSEVEHNTYLNSRHNTEDGMQSQRIMNQMLQSNSLGKSSNSSHKKQKTSHRQPNMHKSPSLDSLNEIENCNSKYQPITDLSQILQFIPPQVLQQSKSKSEVSYIEIQQLPGYPNVTIPITPELLLQCQQLQQLKEPGLTQYQPTLETILEESLSVKHLNVSSFPKTKIVACILTVLCVIVVILLAGDKTVAVAVVAAVFILFLLGSTFYLYTHSSRADMDSSLSHSGSTRLQVSALHGYNKPSLV